MLGADPCRLFLSRPRGRGDAGRVTGSEQHYLEESQVGDYALARGYALAGGSLNVFRTSCADLISAETMMMVKEHFVERFGVPRYTIGSGRSGGSMQQHLITNNYPGLLDGIIPTASFADNMTFLDSLFDCELPNSAVSTSTLPWSDEQKAAVAGQASYAYCKRNGTQYPNLRPTNSDPEALSPAAIYDPQTNRAGARCTYQDNLINVYGRDPRTGFARRPFDNVGVQYGLRAFNEGKISVDHFLDLHRRVGGHDIDGNVVAARTRADADALRIAHETGRLDDASRGLSMVPIIDVRPYTDGDDDVHDIVASHITRARLISANGPAGNRVFLDAMDEWLSNIARDSAAARSPLERVVRYKPSHLVDTCYLASLEPVTDPSRCQAFFPVAGDPRLVAVVDPGPFEVRSETNRSSRLHATADGRPTCEPARNIPRWRMRLCATRRRQASTSDMALVSATGRCRATRADSVISHPAVARRLQLARSALAIAHAEACARQVLWLYIRAL